MAEEWRKVRMENRDTPEGKKDEILSSVTNSASEATSDESQQTTAAPKKGTRRNRGLFGRVGQRLRVPGNTLGRTSWNARNTSHDTYQNGDEPIEEMFSAEDIRLDLTKWLRRLVIPLAILAWAAVFMLVIWMAGYVTRTILLLVVASLLAYALAPMVTFLERVVPRFLAILIVYLIVLGAISGLLYLVVSTAIEQTTSLAGYLNSLLTPTSSGHLSPLEQALNSFGISPSQIASFRAQLISGTTGLAGDVVPLLTGVVNAALDIIVVAVLSVYFIVDGSRVTRWVQRNMPRRQRGRVRFLLETLQRVVGGYIRGQLLLCTLIGLLVGAGMGILGVPYALLLGVLTFILEFIPILGVLATGAICVLLALTKGWLLALIVLVYFVIVHIIEGDVVGPRIVGRAVGLHPAIALIALIAGGELFGIWGALFASPIAGVLQAFLVAIWSEWREMHPQEFQAMKNKLTDKVEENVADKPVDPEPVAKLLYPSDQDKP
jgi:predicted PurR-regulated permease PerM